MKYCSCLLLLLFFASCNNTSTGNASELDSVNAVIDSSVIMNDSTKLPEDSTNTGVTH